MSKTKLAYARHTVHCAEERLRLEPIAEQMGRNFALRGKFVAPEFEKDDQLKVICDPDLLELAYQIARTEIRLRKDALLKELDCDTKGKSEDSWRQPAKH